MYHLSFQFMKLCLCRFQSSIFHIRNRSIDIHCLHPNIIIIIVVTIAPTHSFATSVAHSLTLAFVRSFVHSFVCSFVRLFRSFVRSFVRLFACSLAQSEFVLESHTPLVSSKSSSSSSSSSAAAVLAIASPRAASSAAFNLRAFHAARFAVRSALRLMDSAENW